jgi:hypothetical protein
LKKRNEKRKKWNREMEHRGPQTTQRTRRWSLSAPATLPNEESVADLSCIQHILDANRLAWSDVGHHPDCQFASFIQSTTRTNPGPTHRHAKEMQELASFKRGRKDAMNIPSSNRG